MKKPSEAEKLLQDVLTMGWNQYPCKILDMEWVIPFDLYDRIKSYVSRETVNEMGS